MNTKVDGQGLWINKNDNDVKCDIGGMESEETLIAQEIKMKNMDVQLHLKML